MIKGYVVNNTGRSKHIFKKTVYPGQQVDLEQVYLLLGAKVPEGSTFVEWLEGYLPPGWEVNVVSQEKADFVGGRMFKETLTAIPEVVESASVVGKTFKENNEGEDVDKPSLEYSTPRVIKKMTARDIFNLRVNDNPRRILKNINSIHKLRRALSLCKNDSRKATISRLIQGRIRELNITL